MRRLRVQGVAGEPGLASDNPGAGRCGIQVVLGNFLSGKSTSLVFFSGSFQVTHDYLANIRDTMTHGGPDGRTIRVSADARVGLANRF